MQLTRAAWAAAVAIALAVLLAFLLALDTAGAAAAVPDCPPAPPAYSGSDDAAAQTNALRQDLHDECAALAGRIDQLDADVQLVHGDTSPLGGKLDQLHTDLGGTLTTQTASGAPASTVALSDADRQQLDEEASGLHGDIWVLAGVVVGCFAFGVFLRKVFL